MNTRTARKDHRPVYIQIAETIHARVLSGYYNEKIDGELPLAGAFGVSRRTIQQALELLVREGLLVRRHGMGTFIHRRSVERRFREIASITESITGQGLKPEFTVLASGPSSEPCAASPEERTFFQIGADDPVYRHERLLSTGGRPLAVVESSLNLKFLPGLELSHLSQSLYQTLHDRFGRTIVEAEDRFVPAVADKAAANLLGLAEGSAIFIGTRRGADQTGAPVEISRIVMLPVPLEISIRNAALRDRDVSAPPQEWHYTVGFGDFLKGY